MEPLHGATSQSTRFRFRKAEESSAPPVFVNQILGTKYQMICYRSLVATASTMQSYVMISNLVLQEQQHSVRSRVEHRGEVRGQLAAGHNMTRRRRGQGW